MKALRSIKSLFSQVKCKAVLFRWIDEPESE